MSKRCPFGFNFGEEYDHHDRCNTSGCPNKTYNACRTAAGFMSKEVDEDVTAFINENVGFDNDD